MQKSEDIDDSFDGGVIHRGKEDYEHEKQQYGQFGVKRMRSMLLEWIHPVMRVVTSIERRGGNDVDDSLSEVTHCTIIHELDVKCTLS